MALAKVSTGNATRIMTFQVIDFCFFYSIFNTLARQYVLRSVKYLEEGVAVERSRTKNCVPGIVCTYIVERKKERNGLEIWWRATFPQMLALLLILLTVTVYKTHLTDGRMTESRATTQSSRAKEPMETESN